MAVIGNIKRGDILECHFGNYTHAKDGEGNAILDDNGVATYDREHFNTRIPHEIRKTRPVVVLGDHKGQYIVVPISSTEDTHANPRKSGVGRGYHIELPQGVIPVTHFYEAGIKRWAKANMVQTVDRFRLSSIYCRNQRRYVQASVAGEMLKAIQEALVRAIGRPELLEAEAEKQG
ncbi:type II toxin-antitoxin system PemK/MazF family toxin [Pseudomonas putida]|nr:type II toxin-antitoxin system PemK/MazF family toxin [Pseudomonas putida]